MTAQYSESEGTHSAVSADAGALPVAQGTPQGHLRLCLMLLALHAALAWDIGAWWARALLLAHFGLFLMWQPVWRGERRVEPRHGVLVVAAGVGLAASNSWWLAAVWLAVLLGLIGGSVPRMADRPRRFALILAAVYLLAMLLMWVVPQLLQEPAPATAQLWLVRYGLPLLPLAIAVIRVDAARGEGQVVVDLFYSMLLFLLVLVLVLGSLVVKQVSDSDYPWALAQTLFVIALLLVALSWLWNPRGGFAGLGQMLSRYLLSLGLPFERWVNSLAELAQDESQPEQFLQAALQGMLGMPWVTGLEWRTAAGGGEIGRKSSHASDFAAPDLMLRVFTRWQPSPAILLHVKLLAQIVGYFYRAKQREQLQRRNAYAQAIHETGARLTHDVKNLLQSLHSLCAAAEISGPERAAELQALMQRQLPLVTQRLSDTLDKLRAPQVVSVGTVDAAKWWETLMERYSAREIHFALESAHDGKRLCVPAELYDRVADNLIENGLRKRAHSPDTALTVTFSLADSGRLAVCDTGLPIEEGLARQLFIAPVASRSGLGVGLYHAACQAAELGYVLRLAANETGKVCFELRRCAVPPA